MEFVQTRRLGGQRGASRHRAEPQHDRHRIGLAPAAHPLYGWHSPLTDIVTDRRHTDVNLDLLVRAGRLWRLTLSLG